MFPRSEQTGKGGCFDVLFAVIVAVLFPLRLQFMRDCDSVSLLLLGTVIALLVLYCTLGNLFSLFTSLSLLSNCPTP